jgi:plastocyanin
VTIQFANKDSGVPHNLHVFQGVDAKGDSVGETDIASGPVTQNLKLNLAAGGYFYRCDAHPTTMNGTLTVQ